MQILQKKYVYVDKFFILNLTKLQKVVIVVLFIGLNRS